MEHRTPSLRQTIYSSYRSRFVGYGELTTATMEWKRRVFLPLLEGIDKSAYIVELGCGGGELLSIIGDAGWVNATGVDVSQEQVERAAARGLSVVCQDAQAFLVDRDETVACVIAVDFLEHLTRDELATLLPQIHSALVPGGKLIVQTVNAAGLNGARVAYGDLTHMTIFTESSIEQLLRTFGFTPISISETGPRAIGLRGVLRVVAWRLIRAIPYLLAFIESGARQRIWTENLLCVAIKGSSHLRGSA